ncbi:MAG: relaxase/mobilization nuclease domain-containing protein [Microcoleus sp. SIO2G3]|nr:relaxase/mobilization nuclease domain-containing protein [Microcoleus sp. SIO2G3]
MIGKLMRNDSFQETTRYVLGKEEARILTGGTIAEETIAGIAQEFLMSRDLKPTTKQPVYHLVQSYSSSDRDTRTLDDDRLSDLALRHFAGLVVSARQPKLLKEKGRTTYRSRVKAFLEEDIFEYQFFIAKHEDTDHTHTHLVASRINLHDGKTIHTYKDYYRNQIVCRELEKDFGLEQLPSTGEVDRRSPSRQQKEKQKKTGIAPVLTKLQNTISDIAAQMQRGASFDQFVEALAQKGVETRRVDRTIQNENQEDEIQVGLSYAMDGVAIPSSKLGKSFTYPGLQKQFEIDKPELERTRRMLDYGYERLEASQRDFLESSDGKYQIERDASGAIAIKYQNGETVGEATGTKGNWKLAIAQATPEDAENFQRYQRDYQHREQQKEREKQKQHHRTQKRDRGIGGIGD